MQYNFDHERHSSEQLHGSLLDPSDGDINTHRGPMHLQEETISENDPPQIMDFENNFMINQNGQGSQQFDELK